MQHEKYDEHWEDDLHAARGVFGYPLIIGCMLTALMVIAASYLLDRLF